MTDENQVPAMEVVTEEITPSSGGESVDSQLSEVWDRLSADNDGDKAGTTGETKEPDPVPAAPVEDAPPSEVPKAVQAVWGKVPAEAREAIIASQRDMQTKLSEQGRVTKEIAPIRDVIAAARENNPALANMRPEAIAEELLVLSEVAQGFRTDPVGTMMQYIRQYGLEDGVSQALGAAQQAPTETALRRELAEVKAQLQRVADPAYLEQQFETFGARQKGMSSVSEFAQASEHWAAVEEYMPGFVNLAKSLPGSDGASAQDILTTAYNMAVSQIVAPKASPVPAAAQAAPVDPEKAKAALSVNVKSSPSGKSAPVTEDQLMEAAWRRLQA
jgi:hypothetical protein